MGFARYYEHLTGLIVSKCPPPDKFAHTYAGLTIWLLAGLILRRPLRSPLPLVIVLAVEIANESLDRLAHGEWRWHDTLTDAAATWWWPAILTALLRWYPLLRR